MEEHETVLSDVHLYASNSTVSGRKFNACGLPNEIAAVISRFPFTLLKRTSETEDNDDDLEVDEDGDLVVARKKLYNQVVLIEHTLATPLSLVGLQVWTGALLLSDYLLHIGGSLKNLVALELGSGTGLCSIVLGMFAKTVFCTDVGDKVLELCQQNVDRNLHLLLQNEKCKNAILVKELDWEVEHPFDVSADKWNYSIEERTLAQHATFYMASDA